MGISWTIHTQFEGAPVQIWVDLASHDLRCKWTTCSKDPIFIGLGLPGCLFLCLAKGGGPFGTASLVSPVRSTKGRAEGLLLLNILLCRGIATYQENIGTILVLICDMRQL